MDFTKEQQEHIDKLLKDSKKGLFTEEELNRRVTSEVDRRVESGIQKGLETHRSKWKEEFEQNAQLTAEELAQKQLEEKLNEIESREVEIQKKANLINAKDKLTGAEVPKDQYENFINMLVVEDEKETESNIDNFIKSYNTTKSTIESNIRKELSKVPAPNVGSKSNNIDKKKFEDMTYNERLELKRKDEKLYNELTK